MKAIGFALLACVTLAAITAHASDEAPSQKVSLAGLDLTQPQGTLQAYRRIRSAAEWVCRDLSHEGGVRRPLMTQCVEQAVERAVADVNAPALTAYHETKIRKTGKPARVVAR